MKNSTKKVYDRIEELHRGYFDNKKMQAVIEKGRPAISQRFDQFYAMADELHKVAETDAAHKRINDFIEVILADTAKHFE